MLIIADITTEKRIGDTGDPWGRAPVNSFPDSWLPSKLKASSLFVVNAITQLIRYLGILIVVIICIRASGRVLLKAPLISCVAIDGRGINLDVRPFLGPRVSVTDPKDLIRVSTAKCSGLPPNWSLEIASQVIAEFISLSAAICSTSFARQGKREIGRYADGEL
jgi:hypothetical protein